MPATNKILNHLVGSASFVVLVASLLAGCAAVGPDYKTPTPPAGATLISFKENEIWKAATPSEVDLKQSWWKWYNDPVLDRLVAEANLANPTIEQAAAQYRQAYALIQGAESAALPTLGVSVGGGRTLSNTPGAVYDGSIHNWGVQSSWEPDFWGRVNRQTEAARAGAEASASDLVAAKLAIQASLVNDYLQLRADDALLALYARTLDSYEKALRLTQSQFRAGVVTPSDVALADTTLQSARAQATDIGLARKQLEHAIAVLLGKTPSEFSLAPFSDAVAGLPSIPKIPNLLPSTLLERRPDIAGAERRVAVANANIGVAQSAWYPNLALAASFGNSGPRFGDWIAAPYRVWALGAELSATLFDGGLRTSQNNQAKAAFDAAASNYRQIVLAGFQEVEDNLAALRDLAVERAQQAAAVTSARTAERIATSQYRAGTVLYLSVVTAQNLTLSNERAALQVQGRLFAASVALIKATGGGWNTETVEK